MTTPMTDAERAQAEEDFKLLAVLLGIQVWRAAAPTITRVVMEFDQMITEVVKDLDKRTAGKDLPALQLEHARLRREYQRIVVKSTIGLLLPDSWTTFGRQRKVLRADMEELEAQIAWLQNRPKVFELLKKLKLTDPDRE